MEKSVDWKLKLVEYLFENGIWIALYFFVLFILAILGIIKISKLYFESQKSKNPIDDFKSQIDPTQLSILKGITAPLANEAA